MDIGSVHGGLHNEAPKSESDLKRRTDSTDLEARMRLAEVADEAYRNNRPDDVRHDRVIRAQVRIEEAFYSREEIRQALVDRLATADDLDVEDDDEPADRRLDEIKQQIRRGDYLNNDIVTGLADRLADTWSDGLE